MPFLTKLDFSNNRQVKQHTETITILSGETSFGVPFSALTSGPNLLTTGFSQSYNSIASTFSGNSGTTVFTWYDNRMSLGATYLSAITPSNSATTQNTGQVYTASSYTIIDGNRVNLGFTGVSFDISVIAMVNLGGGAYSGTVDTSLLLILSANSLDFTGRTIWVDVSGITRTDKLIVRDSPVVGYVLSCIDTEGRVSFQALSGVTGPNTYVTGGTYSSGTATFTNNTGGTFTVTGFSTGSSSTSYWSASSGTNAIVVSGSNSTASGLNSLVTAINSISAGNYSNIIGGRNHSIINTANDSVIVGGSGNTINSGVTGSVVLGGTGLTATTSNTVFTPKVISLSGITTGTFNTLGTNFTNYTELASNNTTSGYMNVGNLNLSRPYGLGGNSNATYIGTYSVAYWNRDTAFNLAATTSSLIGSDNLVFVTTSASTTINKVDGVRSWITNRQTTGATLTNSYFFRAYAATDQPIWSMTNIYGYYMDVFTGMTGYNGSTTRLWGIYIEDPAANNYMGKNLWIGTTGGSENLDVNGNGRFRQIGAAASSGALYYTADGTLTTNTSDSRLKTNVITITSALDKVKALRGVYFNWNETPDSNKRIGFIAQEVNNSVPELTFVNENSPSKYMGVHYDNVTALLVEAVKELSSGVTSPNNTHLETQTILAEDNNIELNYNGNKESALGGGIRVLHAKDNGVASEISVDGDGNWVTNNDFKANGLIIPRYTPSSTNDMNGSESTITMDDNYLYVKTNSKWKRVKLEEF